MFFSRKTIKENIYLAISFYDELVMFKKSLAGAISILMALLSACNTTNKNPQKQCLRINFKDEPTSLDPRRGRNMSGASQLHAMIFEGLMRLESNGILSCAQANSYEISSDQKTYTFYLGNNYWSDGTPVTAYDFEKTWKNILDPKFPALDTHVLYCIKNASAAKRGELPLNSIGIYAKDAKTLIVDLEHPTPHFLQITASNALFPINQAKDRDFPNWHADATDHFVCNGPFKLAEWKHHNYLLFEKNKSYRLADKIKLESIYVSIVDNESAALHMYNSKNLDITGLPISPLPSDSYPDLMQKNLLNIFRAPGTMVCMFNTKQFPFHNLNMRKAFSYAINRQTLIDNITQLKEDPAFGVVPPFIKNKTTPYFEDANIQKAQACFQKGLEELGIEARDLDGKISFSYWAHDHGCPMLPQALQQQWLEHLGVKVELDALEYKALHDKGKKGQFSIGYFVFLSMYHDPIELLDRFKNADNPRNYGRWQNEVYADLIEKSSRAESQKDHFALLEQAEELLMDEMPFAPIFHWNYALLVQPHVKGFAVSPLGYLCFDGVSIEK
jgi:oligopeptide transport system substrate-binding protein